MRTPSRMDIPAFILKEVEWHPHDLVSFVAKTFSISRQRAYEHVVKQVKQGVIVKTGRTNSTRYFLSHSDYISGVFQITPELKEDEVWTQIFRQKMSTYPKNVYKICNYGFTEILNNAIDHSLGKSVYCSIKVDQGVIKMSIHDDGIGIFYKIQKALGLPSLREAILHLSKGKFTTDPSRHSGQGIFFTSRVMDSFCILSDGMYYSFREGDWLLSKEKNQEAQKGTYVSMEISIASARTAIEVMNEYSDVETGFHKTIVGVELSEDPGDPHVSRSQAKRLLMGLEKFKHIVLDFQNVEGVGQAFVDELFRVFQSEHPEIKITYVNANTEVEFMIKSGLASSNSD